MIEYIYLLLSIPIHELGHYIGYRICKQKPNIKLKWFGIIIGSNVYDKLNVREALLVNYYGIFFGFLFLYFLVSNNILLIYLLLCCIDIVNIISLIEVFKYKKETLHEIKIIQCKNLIRR